MLRASSLSLQSLKQAEHKFHNSSAVISFCMLKEGKGTRYRYPLMSRDVHNVPDSYPVPLPRHEYLRQHVGPGIIRMLLMVVPVGSSGIFGIRSYGTHEFCYSLSVDVDPFIL